VLICLTTFGKSSHVERVLEEAKARPTENDRPPSLRRRINHRNGGLSIF